MDRLAHDVEGGAASPRQIPETLGRYELLGALAHGGMGAVYLARHTAGAGFQRLFAVKVLHPHLAADPDIVNMLLDEARIAARLHHPNIVPVVDVGTERGVTYIVMEYVEGPSLGALLTRSRGQRPPRLVVPIVLDMLEGLHAAHTLTDDDGAPMHIVHRDVSPQNVLVGVDGLARLIDFGVAKAEARITSTQAGQIKGKVEFMSPEQVRDSADLDHRSDIFAAGVVLWTALTGQRLFRGSSDAATLSNVLTMPVPPPSTVGLKPPDALDAICARALERDRDARYPSAQAMSDALREAAEQASLLGTRREVAEWIAPIFRDELETRRQAVRAALSASGPRASLPSLPSAPESWPSISRSGPLPGSDPLRAELTPSSPSRSATSLVVGPPQRGRVWLLAGGIGSAFVLALVGGWLLIAALRAPAGAARSERAQTEGAINPVPTAPLATVAAVPSGTPTVASSSEPPAPTLGSAARSSAVGDRASAATASVSAATAPPAPVSLPRPGARAEPASTVPSPSPAEPAKKAPNWDRDSPLPPQ
ncbi:MAG: protein kinase [Myxococcales bacterium]|nr:protein kinase [Myxococcales bacterium]